MLWMRWVGWGKVAAEGGRSHAEGAGRKPSAMVDAFMRVASMNQRREQVGEDESEQGACPDHAEGGMGFAGCLELIGIEEDNCCCEQGDAQDEDSDGAHFYRSG